MVLSGLGTMKVGDAHGLFDGRVRPISKNFSTSLFASSSSFCGTLYGENEWATNHQYQFYGRLHESDLVFPKIYQRIQLTNSSLAPSVVWSFSLNTSLRVSIFPRVKTSFSWGNDISGDSTTTYCLNATLTLLWLQ